MLASQLAKISDGKQQEQIAYAKQALDAARRLDDALRIDLAEATLNDLLDRYHSYHAQQRRNK